MLFSSKKPSFPDYSFSNKFHLYNNIKKCDFFQHVFSKIQIISLYYFHIEALLNNLCSKAKKYALGRIFSYLKVCQQGRLQRRCRYLKR